LTNGPHTAHGFMVGRRPNVKLIPLKTRMSLFPTTVPCSLSRYQYYFLGGGVIASKQGSHETHLTLLAPRLDRSSSEGDICWAMYRALAGAQYSGVPTGAVYRRSDSASALSAIRRGSPGRRTFEPLPPSPPPCLLAEAPLGHKHGWGFAVGRHTSQFPCGPVAFSLSVSTEGEAELLFETRRGGSRDPKIGVKKTFNPKKDPGTKGPHPWVPPPEGVTNLKKKPDAEAFHGSNKSVLAPGVVVG